jgi:hypothetical protein
VGVLVPSRDTRQKRTRAEIQEPARMNQGPFDTLSRQIEELRALIEDIHQAVAATPRYRGDESSASLDTLHKTDQEH